MPVSIGYCKVVSHDMENVKKIQETLVVVKEKNNAIEYKNVFVEAD